MKIFVLLTHALNVRLFNSVQKLTNSLFKQSLNGLWRLLESHVESDIIGEHV
jgi:hypothetical protein